MPCIDHLYLYRVLAFLQNTRDLHLIGCRPRNTAILAVDPYMGDILHVGERQPGTSLRHLILFQFPRCGITGMTAEIADTVVGMLAPVEELLIVKGNP